MGRIPGPQGILEPELITPHQRVTARRTVWVYHREVGTAWVPGNGWGVIMPGPFDNSLHLFRQLNEYNLEDVFSFARASLHHSIHKLGIVAHGHRYNEGSIVIGDELSAVTLIPGSRLHAQMQIIGREFLTPDAHVIFFSCDGAAGSNGEGSNLLRALSALWPGRTVIGFVTKGYVAGTNGIASASSAGNIVDTLTSASPSTEPRGFPRLNVSGPSAVHARDGQIVKWADPRELWRLYQQHNPRGARMVRRNAEQVSQDPLFYYATRIIYFDQSTPNFPEVSAEAIQPE